MIPEISTSGSNSVSKTDFSSKTKLPPNVKTEAQHVESAVSFEDVVLSQTAENPKPVDEELLAEHEVGDLSQFIAELEHPIESNDMSLHQLADLAVAKDAGPATDVSDEEMQKLIDELAGEPQLSETRERSGTVFDEPTALGFQTNPLENERADEVSIDLKMENTSSSEVGEVGQKRSRRAEAKQWIASVAVKLKNIAKRVFSSLKNIGSHSKRESRDEENASGISSRSKGVKLDIPKGERHLELEITALEQFHPTFSAHKAHSDLAEWFEPSAENHDRDVQEIDQKRAKCPENIQERLDANNGNLDMVAVNKEKGITIHLDGTGHTKPYRRAVMSTIFETIVDKIFSQGISAMQDAKALRDMSAIHQEDLGVDFEGAFAVQQLTRVNNQKAVVSYQLGDLRSYVIDKDGNFSRIPSNSSDCRFPPKPSSDFPSISVTLLDDDAQGVISLSDGVFDTVSEMRLGTIWRSLENPPTGFLEAVREHIDSLEGKKAPNAKCSFDPKDEKKADDVSVAFLQTGAIPPRRELETLPSADEMRTLLDGKEMTAFYKTGPTACFGNFADVPDGVRMEDGKEHVARWKTVGALVGRDNPQVAALRRELVHDARYLRIIAEDCTETEAIRLGLQLENDFGDLLPHDPVGHQYRNVEAAFQHGKWLHALQHTEGSSSSRIQKLRASLEKDPLFLKFSTATGDEAFRLSRDLEDKYGKLTGLSSDSWHKGAKQKVMWAALQSKFTQEPFQSLLAATGDTYMLEHKASERAKDNYWSDGGDGMGINALGRMLQALRDGQDMPNLEINPNAEGYVPDEDVDTHAKMAIEGLPYKIYG